MTLLTASQKARIAEYKATGNPVSIEVTSATNGWHAFWIWSTGLPKRHLVSVRDGNKRKQLACEIREEIAR